MKVYEFELNNTIKCHDCGEDIEPNNKIYMFTMTQKKKEGIAFYLCEDCKKKLGAILEAI